MTDIYLTQPPNRYTSQEAPMTTKYQHLTYAQLTRFDDDTVNDEMSRLGLPTEEPADDQFTAEEIAKAMGSLSDDAKFHDGATLATGDYTADQVIAFAKLAAAMGNTISVTSYLGLKIRSLKPMEERHESALRNLKYQFRQNNRETAIRSLLEREDA